MRVNQFWSPASDNSGGGSDGQQSGAGTAGQGDFPDREWMKGLPEPLRASKSLAKFDSPEAAFKSYIELEGKLGKSITIPDQSAGKEEWGKFFSRIGRPESPDQYDVPKGKLDPDFEKTFRARAHQSGLTKAQATDLLASIIEDTEGRATRQKSAAERNAADSARKMREEFGDQYESRMEAMKIGAKALFNEGLQERLERAGILSDPDFIRVMADYGSRFGETQFVRGQGVEGTSKKDPYDWMRERYGTK